MGPMHWIHGWGLAYGICPLGKRTGGRRLDVETFSGRLWIFFLGGRGRGRGLASASTAESFSQECGIFFFDGLSLQM